MSHDFAETRHAIVATSWLRRPCIGLQKAGVLTGKYTSRDLDRDGDSAGVEGTRKGAGAMNGHLTER